MRATFGGSGLVLTLNLKDKEEGNKNNQLECRLDVWKKAKVVVHVVDKLDPKEFREKGFLEEPGFHIEAIPSNKGPEKKTKYNIYIIKKIFDEITNPKGDPIVDGGYFVSRSMYDRVDIIYFAV